LIRRDNVWPGPQPPPQSANRWLAERNPSFLAALTPDGCGADGQGQRRDIHATEFAHTQPRSIQHFEHGVVTSAAPFGLVVADRAVKQARDLSTVEYTRQPASASWNGDAARRIDCCETICHQPLEVAANRGDLPRNRSASELSCREISEISPNSCPRDSIWIDEIASAAPFTEEAKV